MIQHESFQLVNKAAATYTLTLLGGFYQLAATATWGGGSLVLKQVLPDDTSVLQLYGRPNAATSTTFVNALSADGVIYFDLPPGQYQLIYATGTALYANLTRIPLT